MNDSYRVPRCARLGSRKQCILLLRLLLLLAPMLLAPTSGFANPCKEDDTGSVDCPSRTDPGIAKPSAATFRHVGNPVDVITGQKQQREIDFQASGSLLHFSRYYHSAKTDANFGLGQGWRHSYSIKLVAMGDERLRISQADGRWIEFARIKSDDASAVFKANALADGYILQDGDSTWHLPDGKSVRFTGSYPTQISYAHGAKLTLYYQQNRLSSVSDEQGRTLQFDYHELNAELPGYTQTHAGTHAGHLRSVVLPSNERIRYNFDAKKNLVSAEYENDTSRIYAYTNSVFPHHLTSIKTRLGDESKTRAWTYNDAGKVVRYESDRPGKSLSLDYTEPASGATLAETRIAYSTGRQERFVWKKTAADQSPAIVEVVAQDCPTCKQLRFLPRAAQQQTAADVLEQVSHQSNQVQFQTPTQTPTPTPTQRNNAATTTAIENIDTLSVDSLKPVPNSLDQELQLNVDGKAFQFRVEITRLGEVADIYVGTTSLDRLKHKWRDGDIEVCDAQPLLQRSDIEPQPQKGCLEDLMYLIDLAEEIEDLSSAYIAPPVSFGARSGFVAPDDSDCLKNPFESCAELERNFEMAQLSGCAYADAISHCGENWQSVSPESIGLSADQFDNDPFSATLYYNEQTGEYVLSFRGSDDVEDWKDNFGQAGGKATEQYQQAVALALALQEALPGETISFTGHSLGGGLATAAALATGAQAEVFNPAALHPDTAQELGLNIDDADHLVDVTTVDGDLLTAIQEPKPGQWIERHEAPGDHTMIGKPNEQWIEDQKQHYPWIIRNDGVVLHSIDAVTESEAYLLEELCGITPGRA